MQDAKQCIVNGIREILEDCDCGDPTCSRAFSTAKTPLEFTQKLLTTYRRITNSQSMMIAELCDAVLEPEAEKLAILKIKLGVQGENCTRHSAALSVIVMAIMQIPQDQSVAWYRMAILEKAENIVSDNFDLIIHEVQMQEKEKMN